MVKGWFRAGVVFLGSLRLVTHSSLSPAGADKKAEAGAGAATEFQFVSICTQYLLPLLGLGLGEAG